jgi:hypothetical protein
MQEPAVFQRIRNLFAPTVRSVRAAHRSRLTVEGLEDRAVPASFTAATVADLIADIGAANAAGGVNTITLAPGARFTLTAADNSTDGPTGLPVVAAGDDLTILGNGDIIERSTASGTLPFRLLDVASGASLTLDTATLQGGVSEGYWDVARSVWVMGRGGAVFSQGGLTLEGVTVQNNAAQGYGFTGSGEFPGGDAFGGGVYSSGALTITGGTVQNNTATGGRGGDGFLPYFGLAPGEPGGKGLGGGVYVAGGTASITGANITANTAQGGAGGAGYGPTPPVPSAGGGGTTDGGIVPPPATGASDGGPGGNGYGGGVYLAAGTTSIDNSTVTGNSALGGAGGGGAAGAVGTGKQTTPVASDGGPGGNGYGGGVYLAAGTASIDNSTVTGDSALGGVGGAGISAKSGKSAVSRGGAGGAGLGGGLYAAGGTLTVHGTTVTSDTATGGAGGSGGLATKPLPGLLGNGVGGGLYLAPTATVGLDAGTIAHVTNNHASTNTNDIFGTYSVI